MAAAPRGGGSASDDVTGWMLLALVAVIGLGMALTAFYKNHQDVLHEAAVIAARVQIAPALPVSDTAVRLWDYLDRHPGASLSGAQIKAVLALSGSIGRWWIAPLLLILGYLRWKRLAKYERFSRIFTMKTLLEHNAEHFPALCPVVNRDRLILEENPAQGRWRVAESPMLFALRQGIVTDGKGRPVPESAAFTENGLPRENPETPEGGFVFDTDRAFKVYQDRVGPPMVPLRAIETLPVYLQGLIGAFAAFCLGRRDAGQAILDAMSTSFRESDLAEDEGTSIPAATLTLDIGDAKAQTQALFRLATDKANTTESDLAAKTIRRLSRHGAFLYPWIGELLTTARLQGGSLPAQEFIWLRPTNRVLWYYLNPLGGNTVFAEGAGPWAHRLAEMTLGEAIPEPVVGEAVKALQEAIDAEGWFDLGVTDIMEDGRNQAS